MFLHYYGQQGARLNRNESVHFKEDLRRRRTCLFSLLSPVFFNLPNAYVEKLDNVFIDGMVNEGPWNKFWEDLRADWDRFLTPVRILTSSTTIKC